MFAIVEIAGHQYRVQEGDTLKVQKLVDVEVGKNVSFPRVYLVSNGETTTVGTPVVEGAKVEAKLEENMRADKIRVVRFIPKKRHKTVRGHKQELSVITITGITAPKA